MTTTGLRMTVVALTAAIGVIAASAPVHAGGSANSGSASKQQGGGRTLADYNIQKE